MKKMILVLAIVALAVALVGCANDPDKEKFIVKQGYEIVYHNLKTNEWLVAKDGKVYMIWNDAVMLHGVERFTSVYPIDSLVTKGSFNINIK